MDKDTKEGLEVQKPMFDTKNLLKMKDNDIQSTTKSYRQKSSPYRFIRFKPGQRKTSDTSSNSHSALVENMDERLKELSDLISIVKTPQKIEAESIYSTKELCGRKSSPYKCKLDIPDKRRTIKRWWDVPKNRHTIEKQEGAEKNHSTLNIMDYWDLCKQNSSETEQSSK